MPITESVLIKWMGLKKQTILKKILTVIRVLYIACRYMNPSKVTVNTLIYENSIFLEYPVSLTLNSKYGVAHTTARF